jgi:hypothetical protein
MFTYQRNKISNRCFAIKIEKKKENNLERVLAVIFTLLSLIMLLDFKTKIKQIHVEYYLWVVVMLLLF